jgi:hypothetical protein
MSREAVPLGAWTACAAAPSWGIVRSWVSRIEETDVSGETLRSLLWSGAVALGWLAVLSLCGVWYARGRFHSLLKAPLNDEVEHLTHLWEHRITRWRTIGLVTSGLSILLFVSWLVF